MNVAGRVAVITGAAGGIGRGISLALARRGCHLALADTNEEGLAETARLAGNAIRVTRYLLDVTDREAVAAFPERVIADHGSAHLLFNNAGVAIGGTFEEVAEEDFDWLMEVNFFGLVRMTRAFLPRLKAAGEGRIVNLSSIFGIVAPPGQSAYSASKFAVRAFSESLRNELAAENSPVGVTVVHPGGIATSIAKNARPPRLATPERLRQAEADKVRFQAFLKMPPERAGEIIVAGVERGRPRVLCGNDAKIMALIERIAPTSYWKFLGRRLK